MIINMGSPKMYLRDRIHVSKVLKISGSPWRLFLRTLEIITSMQKNIIHNFKFIHDCIWSSIFAFTSKIHVNEIFLK